MELKNDNEVFDDAESIIVEKRKKISNEKFQDFFEMKDSSQASNNLAEIDAKNNGDKTITKTSESDDLGNKFSSIIIATNNNLPDCVDSNDNEYDFSSIMKEVNIEKEDAIFLFPALSTKPEILQISVGDIMFSTGLEI